MVATLDKGPKAVLSLQRKSDNYLLSRRCCKECGFKWAHGQTVKIPTHIRAHSVSSSKIFYVSQYFLELNYFSQKDIASKPRTAPLLTLKPNLENKYISHSTVAFLQAIILKTGRWGTRCQMLLSKKMFAIRNLHVLATY